MLNQGTEVTITTASRTIALNIAGNLDSAGVTGQCLYSFLKEEWKADATKIPFPFPMVSITNEQFEFVSGWKPAADATRNLIRTAGWAEYDQAGTKLREYAGIISLGTLGGTDQPYYDNGGGATNFTYQGAVNQAVQIYGDAANGNFNRRSSFNIFAREQGKKYAQSKIGDIGVSTMTYIVYRFPLANESDLKISASDVTISGSAPYTGITITYITGNRFSTWVTATSYAIDDVVTSGGRWYRCTTAHTSSAAFATDQASKWTAYSGERQIGSSYYAFNRIIAGNNATAEQIYEKIQWSLRQTTDIDAGTGTVIGKTASAILSFVGDTLVTSSGVFIDSYNASDVNRIDFYDVGGTKRNFPYTASLKISFNDILQSDTNAAYWVYFTNDDAGDNTGRDYGTSTAIIAKNASNANMNGNVSGQASITYTYAYDSNVQRGAASAGTDAPITVVALGLDKAQFVSATGTIARSTANAVSLVSSLERNYANPA